MSDASLCKMLKALSNPNRFRIFNEIRGAGETRLLAGNHCSLHSVIEHLRIGASTVSHHLTTLVNAGLISTEKDGKFVLCRINPESIEGLARYFNDAAKGTRNTK